MFERWRSTRVLFHCNGGRLSAARKRVCVCECVVRAAIWGVSAVVGEHICSGVSNLGEDLSDGLVLLVLLRRVAPHLLVACGVSEAELRLPAGRVKALVWCGRRTAAATAVWPQAILEGQEDARRRGFAIAPLRRRWIALPIGCRLAYRIRGLSVFVFSSVDGSGRPLRVPLTVLSFRTCVSLGYCWGGPLFW